MKCPNCNREISDGFKFCPYCATAVVSNKCPHCGATNLPADSKFCPDCGRKLEMTKDEDFRMFNVNGVSFKMIRVEHGEFMMGATEEQVDPTDDEKPVHKVKLTNDFYIGETLVTQKLWRAVMNENPSHFGEGGNSKLGYNWEELPVEQVSWSDCQRFIGKLNSITGKNFRLPSEAEWEFAARGGNKTGRFRHSGSDCLDEVACYFGNSVLETQPVKMLKPNELNIYDMNGNVWEWCEDWKGDYNTTIQTNPRGPICGEYRICRGGSWLNIEGSFLRISYRGYISPDTCRSDLGVRLAFTN